jgi:hypothetical protein
VALAVVAVMRREGVGFDVAISRVHEALKKSRDHGSQINGNLQKQIIIFIKRNEAELKAATQVQHESFIAIIDKLKELRAKLKSKPSKREGRSKGGGDDTQRGGGEEDEGGRAGGAGKSAKSGSGAHSASGGSKSVQKRPLELPNGGKCAQYSKMSKVRSAQIKWECCLILCFRCCLMLSDRTVHGSTRR